MSRIAIVGLAGRFPGAPDVEALWRVVSEGREAITIFSEEELLAAGVAPGQLADPAYVRARGLIDGADLFDAALFGINPREAEIMDPQHRLLLEVAWEALERAGCDPRRSRHLPIGVFAGAGSNTYLLFNLARNRRVVDAVGMYQAMLGSDGDFLATRISYKLGLRGPSLTVQTACSTSLVAVHLACQSLLNGECDLALAGGVRISVPQRAGYLYQAGGIFSPDGHCRPFDAAAQGCLDGDGAGLVVLKRLDDALVDGDHVHAVIVGSAVNNDGSSKIGYTAPSAEGQSEVIALAQALAGVEPSTIGYVEAHGTATPLGDPIEVSALRQVFADCARGSVALGSVKGNLGHLDAAAGIASLIKAVLALERGEIPPTANFERPNPALELEESPFFVNPRPVPWPASPGPRRAGVSSFGIGGTNAHVILEEAPELEPPGASRTHQLVVLSAATETALEAATVRLVDHLRHHPEQELSDVAYTLQWGRRLLPHRRMAVCSGAEDAAETLESLDPRRVLTRVEEAEERPVVFLFPGQGAQYPGMAEALYRSEPAFRQGIDRCAAALWREGVDLLAALYPRQSGPEAAERLRQTALAQVSIFAVEQALARLWMEWGVRPAAMLGHSVGEYVAACLSGVLDVEEAVRLLAVRGRLMQELPPGAMISVPLPEEELRPLLPEGVAVAAVNGPSLCVASGPVEAVEALSARVPDSRRLHTSHAFHSPMMEPVLERFAAAFAGLRPGTPSIPYVSNLTGGWITTGEAADPGYWVRHLRGTVRFSAGLETLFLQRSAVLLEVGPGRALSSLARQHPRRPGGQTVLSSLPAAPDSEEDLPVLLRALGQLWMSGVPVDWSGFHAHGRRRRVVLPGYPFERRRHWVEPLEEDAAPGSGEQAWAPVWKQALPARPGPSEGPWLVLLDRGGLGADLVAELEARGRQVLAAPPPWDYGALLERPRRIVHLAGVEEGGEETFFSLLGLVRALGERPAGGPLHLDVVSKGLQDVESADDPDPIKALLLGVVLTLPQELPGATCRSVDVDSRATAADLLAALEGEVDEPVVALRGAGRWVRTFEPVRLEAGAGHPPLRLRGTYLITGGTGGVGLEIARFLARTVQARLVLVSRSAAAAVGGPAAAELEGMGAEVLALAADVTRPEEMRAALGAARERFGPLHGVIHAAGVPGSGLMQLSADEAAKGVLAPKVEGTRVLDGLLAGEEIDFLVLCSSLSALLGGPGQADYAAANAFLDAFARRRARQGGPRVVSIDWDTWLGVGMAAGARPSPAWPALTETPLSHPLLLARAATEGEEVFLSRFRPGESWVLDEHRLGGHPVVPGTTYLEMAGAAFRELGSNGAGFEMRDVLFIAPLRVGDGESREVRTVLRRDGGGFRFRVASEDREHALGTVLPLHGSPASADLEGLRRAAHTEVVLGEEYREDLRTAGLGPRWESLRQVWVGEGYALGYLELAPELGEDVERFGLHPALLDVATSFGESYVPKGEGHYLPLSYRRLLAHGPLPRRAWSHVRFGQNGGETLAFDVSIFDEEGVERVRIEEFVLKRLDVAQMMRARAGGATEPPSAGPEGVPGGEGEGLAAAAAVELLRRVLAGPRLPQVAICAVPLPRSLESRRRLARELAEGRPAGRLGGHGRPDVATAYVAPRTPLEAKLAEIWQEILGVEPVGAFDDFFELGGHSLLGTQLVSRLRAEMQVELPLSSLFESPVLAGLAVALEGAGRAREEVIPAVPRSGELPLSFAQERLWFLDQLDPGNPFYNVSQAVRMEGALDLGRLFASLQEILRRHEVLRTTFSDVRGRPVQRVLPQVRPILLLVDLTELPAAGREAESGRLLARAAEVPFELARPPLLATTLFRLSPKHHVCVLTLHHIVSDGWSIGVLISELAALYRSLSLDTDTPPLAPLPIQYADFAHWQRQWLEQEVVERQLFYWRGQLAGPLPVLALPTDRPRPAVQTFRGAAEHLTLPQDLTARLKALCHREGATPFMGLLAAFSLLLHRLSGQTDILVGTPIAGRNRKEVEGLIGVFLNTLVLRVDLSGSPSFSGLLGRVRATVLAASSNQDVPIERLLEEIKPDRDLSRSSLFQVFFNMQDFPRRELELPGLTLTSLPIREVPAKFDLTVYAAEVDGEILFELIYNADLFERHTAVGLLARFHELIDRAVIDPEADIARLTTTAPAETPGTGPDWSFPDRCLHEMFEEQAARTPDATALICGGQTLSYRELDERAGRLAWFLRRRGIGPERRVAISRGRSLDLAVALLGVLKAGGAYVALDPEHPEARREKVLEDARPDLVLGTEPLPFEEEGGAGERAAVVRPDNLAWITYTSGSTGLPKGIQASHRGAVSYLTWIADFVGLGPADVVLQVAAPTFDASVRDLLGPLLVGASVVLLPEGTRDPGPALEAIRRHGITAVASAVPTLVRSWLTAAPRDGGFGSLTRLLVSGEMLYHSDHRRLLEVFGPQLQVINHYGPTECTMTTTFADLLGTAAGEGPVPVGRPVGNSRIVLLDPAGRQLTAPGAVGEVHIAGVGLTRGYWNHPDLTAEAFLPDPFDAQGGGRLYQTGDLGRFLPDGSLELLGRRDLQVKIRGNRVELGEIESVLASHSELRAAVAAVKGDRLVAWYVPRPGHRPEAAELRHFLTERLPEHMLPQAFMELESLPLTHTGKLDRGALPVPVLQVAADGLSRPRTPLEEILSTVWCELLQLDQVHIEQSFFELGGHSLMATQLVSRLREILGVEVPVRRLFETPTIAGLARRIESAIQERLAAPEVIPPARRDADLPLSFAQERLWLLEQLEPGSSNFNLSLGVRLRGRIDLAAFRSALQALVARHEPLRTTFEAGEGGPRQRIAPVLELELPLVDRGGLPPDGAREAVSASVAAQGRVGFDLARGPLVRGWVLRLGKEEHVLLLVLHHIVGDGWSMRVLTSELARLYAALAAGEPSPLPELLIQYADFAAWQRSWLSGEVLEEQLGYWRRRLGGELPVLDLPTDRPRPAVQSFRGAETSRILGPELSARLRSLGRQEGATPFMVLLAALGLLLHRYSGQDEVLVGSPIAGRGRTEVQDLIGIFLNTLVLRVDAAGRPCFSELLRRVRHTALEAYAHQDVPFEKLLEELRPERDLSRTPLFQVFLNMLNLPEAPVAVPGIDFEEIAQPEPPARFDLTLYAREVGGVFRLRLVYDAGLFAAERMLELLSQLEQVLEQAVEDAERPIDAISLVTPEARAVLPDPQRELPVQWQGSVQEGFRRMALQDAGRVAVTDPGGSVRYGELMELSGRVAAALTAGGIGREDVVAVYAHRSLPLVAAVLGVLRSGAAFLILDPVYPDARLRQYLDLSQAKGWIALAAAGEPPAQVQDYVAGLPAGRRLVLTRELDGGPALAGVAGEGPWLEVGPDDLALVSFTSGSTGMPKGVLGLHGSLSHFLPWHCRTFGLSGEDRFSLLSALSHDPLQRDIFTPLWIGARLCIPDPDDIGSPGALAEWMEREGVSVTHLTPAMSRLVSEPVPARIEAAGGLRSLRKAFFIGEALTRRDVERLRRLAPEVACINLYGATETQRALSWHLVEGSCEGETREVLPLGQGMEGCQLLVLNRADLQTGVGEMGEICIRSPHLARGYLGGSEAERARFGYNPITGLAEDRLYRTGDHGRYRPDGEVEFVGRSDLEVKVRGFRIDLREVEAALVSHGAVREAVVDARPGPGGTCLVAWMVGRGGRPDAAELRRYLQERLPDAMVPSAWCWLDGLPLTPSGKLDREALPEPEVRSGETGSEVPRTEVEEILCGIFAEVLGRERVDRGAGFFDLGGHSLLAAQLTARVQRSLGVALGLRTVFEHPTVAGLALAVEAALGAAGAGDAPPLVAVARDADLPLSFAQERLWFLDQLDPGGVAYNMPAAVRWLGDLDPGALAAALAGAEGRHEALRTVFRMGEGGPVQEVQPAAGVPLPLVDLSCLPEPSRNPEEMRLRTQEARTGFDLTTGPLLRTRLVRLTPREHMLFLTTHHIVSDGWSVGVLKREIGQIYTALREGRRPQLPELSIQYGDYAVWQRRWLSGEALERRLERWRDRLGGMDIVLDLPLDRPRPAALTYRGARVPVEIPADLVARLRELGRSRGATLFMVLLSGLTALLYRWTGQEEIRVGTPAAGRDRIELEPLIGFFVNTLVLRAEVRGRETFSDLLEQLRREVLECQADRELPFEKVVEALAPERSLSRSPLFQVALAFQAAARPDVSGVAARLEAEESSTGSAKFELMLNVSDWTDGLRIRFEYASDLFDATTMLRLAGQLGELMASAAALPGRELERLELMSEAQRQQMLVEWNDTRSRSPLDRCVHELFLEQARSSPERVAVVAGAEEVRYGELALRAGRVARRLRALGVGPEMPVGLLGERSVETIVGLLGILHAGGAYVPLDPGYPAERLRLILADTEATVVLAQDTFLDRLSGWEGQIIPLEERDGEDVLPCVTGPDNLAYVLFTSGSTGLPKGVGVPHRAVVRLVRNTGYARFGPDEVFLQLAPLSFDASTLEIWGALLNGGRLVLMPPGAASLEEIGEALQRHAVTTLWLTAGLFHRMVEERLEDLAGVRQLLAGGEELSVTHVARTLQESRTRLINGYGPTENTTFTCCCPLDREEDLAGRVPLGRPVAGTRVLVMSEGLEPVLVGAPGEVWALGEGLARGYLRRPDLTAERFVPDPSGSLPGSRAYRTGDLGRWLPDGRLEFLGRIDHQVKLRGFRIEPGEVEAALAEHPAVRTAVVGVRGEEAGRQLAAWVVPEAQAPSIPELRSYLQQKLPDYMIPSIFVFLDALPLTANGKIDRSALPEPEPVAASGEAPRTAAEEIVAGIYSDVLRLDEVGRESSFFDLGGHSLLATRVVSRLRQVFGVDLSLRTLFEHPTAEALAGAVEEALQAGQGLKAPPPAPVPRGGDLPLSFAQERLWIVDQIEPGSSAYNIPVAVRLSGDLDVPTLRRCFQEIARRHEILRTTFPPLRGRAWQRIAPPGAIDLPQVDLGALEPGAAESEARRHVAMEVLRPFGLAAGPLLRVLLLRLQPQEHVFVVTLHHIVSDGWSMSILVREMVVLYEAFRQGRSSPLPELPIQYADFAQWQRGWLQGELLQRQLAYWRRQLRGAPSALLIPPDLPRPAQPSHRGATATYTVGSELTRALRDLSRQEGVTLYMLLLAAFSVLLHRDTGRTDLLVGSAIANRNRLETEGLIGFFVNMLVLRLDLSGTPRFREVLERVRAVALGAYSHQDLPFERMAEEIRSQDGPLLQVAFGLNNAPLEALEAPGLSIRPYETGVRASRFDLTVWVVEQHDQLRVSWNYAADLFLPATIHRLHSRYESLLGAAMARPDSHINAIEIGLPAPEADRQDEAPPGFRRARRRIVAPSSEEPGGGMRTT